MPDENQTPPEEQPQIRLGRTDLPRPETDKEAALPPPTENIGAQTPPSTEAAPAEVPAPVIETPPPPPAPPVAPEVADSIRERQAAALAKRRQRRWQRIDKILELAGKRRKITNDEVQKALHVSDASASRYLVQLVKEGKLKRAGRPEHAYYEPL